MHAGVKSCEWTNIRFNLVIIFVTSFILTRDDEMNSSLLFALPFCLQRRERRDEYPFTAAAQFSRY